MRTIQRLMGIYYSGFRILRVWDFECFGIEAGHIVVLRYTRTSYVVPFGLVYIKWTPHPVLVTKG